MRSGTTQINQIGVREMNKPKFKKTLPMLAAVLALGAGSAMADGRYDRDGHHNQGYEQHHDSPGFGGFVNGHLYADRGVDARQQQQKQRIMQGIRSGELSRSEAQRLLAEQREIARLEYKFRSDGVLDAREVRVLDRELDEAGRHIFQQKHDADDRNRGWR
jgi:hypothetical protein